MNELKYSKLTHISDWKHMRDEWVGMKVNCTSTYGNILCGSGWLESEVHVKTLFWHMLFSHYAAKLSGWGSSGRRRRRSDWGRSQCLLSRKVRDYIQILFTCFSPSGSVKNVCIDLLSRNETHMQNSVAVILKNNWSSCRLFVLKF